MGSNVVNEGWRKPHCRAKRSRRCRFWCCCARQQMWRKRKSKRSRPRRQQRSRSPRGGTARADLRALLRPVNVNGKRAAGMRAPRDTTQFLRHEKYQELLRRRRQAAVGPPERHKRPVYRRLLP
uniref:coiled-coil domain-containing glutamate-rich protein 1 n=1 Tax=Pristiophorus japonicus TaxID=55135 RepID=UPI00398EE5F2